MKRVFYIFIGLAFITSTIACTQILKKNDSRNVEVKSASKVQRSDKYNFIDFNMIDSTYGWAVSKEGILKTGDGGFTWENITPKGINLSDRQYIASNSKSVNNNSLFHTFLDKEIGFIAYKDKNKISIFKTFNGGQKWEQTILNLERSWNNETIEVNIDVVNSKETFVMVTSSKISNNLRMEIYKTDDSGNHWSKVTKNVIDSLNNKDSSYNIEGITGIKFISSNMGWYTMKGEKTKYPFIYNTKDGGVTWEVQKLNVPKEYLKNNEYGINTFPPKFSKDNKQGYLPVEFKSKDKSSMIFYKTIDGGATWNPSIPVEAQGGIEIIYGVDKDGILWIVDGGGNKIYRIFYNDSNVNEITTEINLRGRKVQFIDKNTGLLILEGILYKTQDKGITWEVVK
ncbi:photosystem II stability/assembly factor-like uncharacterized protein [Clostridium pascui]|uniref:hypothetical protein n=1 Tax=Clostridium pascui TaxID=46609 RepID=UPI00195A9B88|nr:hypothetical protein [Clostridium pascui]MBM7870977.1 photosystem II stability/assembly factor-like uncharacterized protein [Clostridium pascui]